MKANSIKLGLGLIACCLCMTVGVGTAWAGKIVVNHDEWTLSNTGFSSAPDAAVFADNVARFFTGGGVGNFHAFSGNFGLTGSSLATAMSNAGHTWTVGTGITFDLATLQTYDGIFLAGTTAGVNTAVLTSYVQAGGNVYLAGGTGNGGAVGEAAFWNPFLNSFGLGFGSPYNGVGGNLAIGGTHQIFNNVSTLYHNNGNPVLDTNLGDPGGQIVLSNNGKDLYGVYDSTVVPLPAAAWMGLSLLGGVGVTGKLRRRRA